MSDISEWLRIARRPAVVRRAWQYGLGVGTLLIAINHEDAIMRSDVSLARLVRTLKATKSQIPFEDAPGTLPGTMPTSRDVTATSRSWAKVVAAAAVVVVIVAIGWLLPVRPWTLALADHVRGASAKGVLLFIAAYVVATVALLPGSVLTLAAGFAYGPVGGLLVASPASVIAAMIAFLLGRTALRGWVQRQIATAPRARALDRAVGKDSFRLILLLRLSPVIPFNVLNYALGISEARLGQYLAASFLGMLPGTWMYVYLGSLAVTAAGMGDASRAGAPGRMSLTVLGLAATVAVVVLVTRSARRALDEELAKDRM